MSNLKRVLAMALVFALVMSLGFTAFAAESAAEYTDAGDIGSDYTEAVDTVSQYHIMMGDGGTGNFAPDRTLTREEFALMVARVMNGGAFDANGNPDDTAFARFADQVRYTDVPADHWAAGAIGYCSLNGIIAGYGDGRFGLGDTLTANQVFKMLLVMLGFEAEDFTPASWEIVTYTFMNKYNIALDALVLNAKITRQEAASALAVAMKSKTVTKNTNGIYIVGDKTYIQASNKFAANYPEDAAVLNAVEVEGVLVQNKYFSIDDGTASYEGDVFLQVLTDGYGTPGDYIIINNVSDDDAFPVGMIGARVKVSVSKTGTDKVYNYVGKKAALVDQLVTIKCGETAEDKFDTNATLAKNSKITAGTHTSIFTNGVLGEAKDKDGNVVDMITNGDTWRDVFTTSYLEAYAFRIAGKNEYRAIFRNDYTLGRVASVDGSKVKVNTAKDSGDGALGEKTFENAAELFAGDFIIYSKFGSSNYQYKTVDSFAGIMTAYNTNGDKATINGSVFTALGLKINSNGATDLSEKFGGNLNATANFGAELTYVSYNGKLIAFIPAAAASTTATYCIVTEAVAGDGGTSGLAGTASKLAKVRVLTDDGSTGVYEVEKCEGIEGKYVGVDSTAAPNIPADKTGVNVLVAKTNASNEFVKVYQYTISEDGKITLKEPTLMGADTGVKAYTKGNTLFASQAVGTGTVWFVYSKSSTAWVVRKGTNLMTATDYNANLSTKDGAIQFAIVNSSVTTTETSNDYLYVASPINFGYDNGVLVASFRAVNIKTGEDMDIISLVPGKKLNGTDSIANNDAGVKQGDIVEFKVDGDGFYTGSATTPTATSSSLVAASPSSKWYKMSITNYVNGMFKNVKATGTSITAGTGIENDIFYSTSDTLFVDCSDVESPAKKAASDFKTTVNNGASTDDTYYEVIVEIKEDANGNFEVKKFIALTGATKFK